MTTPPVLAYIDFEHPFVVELDAFSKAAGKVLAQKRTDGKMHPIMCATCNMEKAKIKYGTCEGEALAVNSPP